MHRTLKPWNIHWIANQMSDFLELATCALWISFILSIHLMHKADRSIAPHQKSEQPIKCSEYLCANQTTFTCNEQTFVLIDRWPKSITHFWYNIIDLIRCLTWTNAKDCSGLQIDCRTAHWKRTSTWIWIHMKAIKPILYTTNFIETIVKSGL